MKGVAPPLELEHTDPQPHLGRVWTLVVAAVLIFAGLASRLYFLQVVTYAERERLASRNRVRYEPSEAARGGIYDRWGTLLAGSRMTSRISILELAREPESGAEGDLGDPRSAAGFPRPTLAEQLALLRGLLALQADEVALVQAALTDIARPKFTPVVVRDDVDTSALIRVEERLWELPSVVVEKVPRRSYPAGAAVAHVLGYVGSIDPSGLNRRRATQDLEIRELQKEMEIARRGQRSEEPLDIGRLSERLAILQRLRQTANNTVGKTGIEAFYENELQGEPGIRTWQVNARSLPTQLVASTPGLAGHSLCLTIDLALQRIAAAAMSGRRGSVVAVDTRSGAVLALYSSPSYDPNLFVPRIGKQAWQSILQNDAHPLENRALRGAFPPGSIYKMVTAAAGLESGAVTDDTAISCGGGLRVGSSFKKCWQVHGGGIDLIRAIQHSCDVFFYQAGLRMGPEPIRQTAAAFGLGRPTGIDLPNEKAGRVPAEPWHRSHHERDWYAGDTANLAIGQGDVQVTSLQMALVTAAVANGGLLWQPQVVREVRNRDRTQVLRGWAPKLAWRVPVKAPNLERIRRGMRAAVTGGTAGPVALPAIDVAGKTGSAEDPPRDMPHAWFVCFAPFQAPEVAVAVMVENGGHGSEAAAPVARALLVQYFTARKRTP